MFFCHINRVLVGFKINLRRRNQMNKFLLVMCFLGASNLFAESCDSFCSSIVFQKDSAYIKTDAIPVLKTLCDKYSALEPFCSFIDFRADNTAWVQELAVEAFYKYCNSISDEQSQSEDSFWTQFSKAAAVAHWRR